MLRHCRSYPPSRNMEKSELRKHIRQLKRQYTAEQLREQSVPIMERLLRVPQFSAAKTVLMYYSLDDEVYTHDAIDTLLNSGKTVLLPAVIGDGLMELHSYTGHDSLRQGALGIMEPVGDTFTDFKDIEAVAVPGMAFDKEGNRLGRGKGYYDRLLPKLTSATLIGVAFQFQKFNSIPAEPHDIKMDMVL